jgi:hypothetical protein
MPILNYRRTPPDRPHQRRSARTEFIIVLAGALVLTAILFVLYRIFVPPVEPF